MKELRAYLLILGAFVLVDPSAARVPFAEMDMGDVFALALGTVLPAFLCVEGVKRLICAHETRRDQRR